MSRAKPILPWIVWTVAVLSYVAAIINRSSLAALGPATQEHFEIDATALAIFPVLQLIVYAALQIPVGVLLDRIGATRMILIGGLLMLVGQVVMALTWDVGLAMAARVLVGAGDACTFISVMKLLPEWFAVRQLPTVSQLTGLIGQAGQLISVTPLAFAVSVYGWASGFLGIAAVLVILGILGMLVLRDMPGRPTEFERWTGKRGRLTCEARSLGDLTGVTNIEMAPPSTGLLSIVAAERNWVQEFGHRARRLLRIPGVRLAFWLHFTAPFAANTFALLWGTPFLTGGLGMSQGEASGLLSLFVVSLMVAGVVLGPLSSRFVERRVWIHVAITVAVAVVWIAVLVWPGTPPFWLILTMLIVVPFGGPASMIAFEVSRSHTPRSFSGFGTGLVNMGGFIATLIVILLIGLMLDVQGAGSPDTYSLDAFRWAFAVQIPVWVLGLAMIVIEQRRTKRWMIGLGRTLR